MRVGESSWKGFTSSGWVCRFFGLESYSNSIWEQAFYALSFDVYYGKSGLAPKVPKGPWSSGPKDRPFDFSSGNSGIDCRLERPGKVPLLGYRYQFPLSSRLYSILKE